MRIELKKVLFGVLLTCTAGQVFPDNLPAPANTNPPSVPTTVHPNDENFSFNFYNTVQP